MCHPSQGGGGHGSFEGGEGGHKSLTVPVGSHLLCGYIIRRYL